MPVSDLGTSSRKYMLVAFECNNFRLPDCSGINGVYLQLFDRVVTYTESGKRRVSGMKV